MSPAASSRRLPSLLLASLLLAGACSDGGSASRGRPLDEALIGALRIRDPLERAEVMGGLLRQLDASALDRVLPAFESQLAWAPADAVGWFATALARIDPAMALERVLQWPRSLRQGAAGAVVAEWAIQDPRAAAAALGRRPELDLRVPLIESWARRDPAGAIHFAADQPAGPARARQIQALVESVRRSAGGRGVSWLDTLASPGDLPGGFARELLLAGIADAATFDPVGTAAWLAPRLAGDKTAGSVEALTEEWAATDPSGAAAWLLALPGDGERDRALQSLFAGWLGRDADEAAGWLAQVDPQPALDPLLAHLALEEPRIAPRDAISFAARIRDPERRIDGLRRALQRWMAREPAAAAEFLASSPLAAELRPESAPPAAQAVR